MEEQATQETSVETSAQETSQDSPHEASLDPGMQTYESTDQGQAEAQAQAEAPTYNPNYKFKVMDQEVEVDEFLRGAITSPEHEQRIRELYEKAYGLDHVKPKYERIKQEHGQLTDTWKKVEGNMQVLSSYLKEGDLGSFFGTMGLTDEQVMKYAVDRLSYYELPPEKRQELDMQQRKNKQYVELMRENESLKTARLDFERTQLETSLNSVLNHPQVTNLRNQIDARAGRPGVFRDLVIAHAKELYSIHGKDPSPEEAVASYLRLHGFSPADGHSATPQAAQAAPLATGARQNTIPKFKSSGVSPVKQRPSSTDDLREKYKQLTSR